MILIHMLHILSSTEKRLGNEIETYILNELVFNINDFGDKHFSLRISKYKRMIWS